VIRGVHHTAISTPDLDRIVHFYRDVVGFEEVGEFAWPAGFAEIDRKLGLGASSARGRLLRAANTFLEFFEYGPETDPSPAVPRRAAADHGFCHIGLDVDDVEAEYERMRALGMEFIGTPSRPGEGAPLTVFGRDPDGNIIEMQEAAPPGAPNHLAVPATGGTE
jgi:catechol 2,3-dioxygenase-like lactoylglutathione lyase family enzyme